MEMDAAAATSFTWTSTLIQDPNNPSNTRVVLKRIWTQRLQDTQDDWTCTLVDDPRNPRVTLRRRVPEKDAPAGEAAKPQVTTRKRVTMAKKERVPRTGWLKSMRGFLQQRYTCQTTGANCRPALRTCKGDACRGECHQGVACKGVRPPPPKHHLLMDEDYFANSRTCIVIDEPNNSRMAQRRKRPSTAVATKRPPGPCQRLRLLRAQIQPLRARISNP